MSVNASKKQRVNAASIGESKRQIKTYGVTTMKRKFREKFEDRAILSLIEFINLSIYIHHISQ